MDFVKSLFGAKKNVPAANIRVNNRKNMVPAPAANIMVVAPPAPPAPPAPNTPQFGGRKRTRKNKKSRKARKTTRKGRKGSC